MVRKMLFFNLLGLFVMLSLTSSGEGADVILSGAGATFPYPLYEKWIGVYQEKTRVRVSYQAVGSGAGIKKLLEKEVDFGATDAFMSRDELDRAKGDILHIPTCLGAVTIIYHLPGNPVLRFTPELLSDIFMERVTHWSDEAISEVNPGVRLPDLEILVVHRSEESGTTFIFTDYLSKVSSQWRDKVGCGKKVRWLTGMGVEGNPGMAELVKKVPGSIGYVELAYAKRHAFPVALIKNRSGRFITPTLESVSRAADIPLPSDTRILITDTKVPQGYPISAFTWLIIFKEQSYNHRSREKAEQLARFLWWTVHEGQHYTNHELLYAPLPGGAVRKAEAVILSMGFDKKPLFETSPGGLK